MQADIKNIILHLVILINLSSCRDFYLGMFKKNDLLMAHDTLFKERIPFRFTYAKYGRKFNCPITYVRVLDRLSIGRGPRVEVIRGGLQKKYVVLRLTSPYNNPISVNIFVGCANKKYTNPPWKIIRPTIKTTTLDQDQEETTSNPTDETSDESTSTVAENSVDNESKETKPSEPDENSSPPSPAGGEPSETPAPTAPPAPPVPPPAPDSNE